MSCNCGQCDIEIKCSGAPNDDGSWIQQYFHCSTCLKDKPKNISPAMWARINTGWTVKGLQVWCARCERNIINLDFEGQKVTVIPDPI